MATTSDPFFAPGRLKVLRRLLVAMLVLDALVVGWAVAFLAFGNARTGLVLLGIAGVLGASSWLARRAILEESYNARRLTVLTGVLAIVFSLPLIQLLVGLLTAIAGIGLVVVTLARDREPR